MQGQTASLCLHCLLSQPPECTKGGTAEREKKRGGGAQPLAFTSLGYGAWEGTEQGMKAASSGFLPQGQQLGSGSTGPWEGRLPGTP